MHIKSKRLLIIKIIVVIVVIIFMLYLMNNQNSDNNYYVIYDLDENLIFTISIDKDTFSINESINVTFKLFNDGNGTIQVSEFRNPGTLRFYLRNSSNKEMVMEDPSSIPYSIIKGITLKPMEFYEEIYNIKKSAGYYKNESDTNYSKNRFYFNQDSYLFYAQYRDFHPHEIFNWDNSTTYKSNNITFQIL